jgi:tetratricopeptide (TPR) repeat protein
MSNSTNVQPKRSGTGITWLYNPALDLVIGCGAWSLPLLLVAYAFSASAAQAGSVAFYALALFFNYPHYMATIYRAYHRAEDFEKYRLFTVYTTAVVLFTMLVSHFWVGILPWIFTLYLTWSPWHYTGQNYGVFMMFARRAGANLSQTERRAIYAAFIASYLVLFLSFHTGASSDPLFHSLGIPAQPARFAEIVLASAFVSLSLYGFSPLLRDLGWRKFLPCATLFSSQILWFLVPVGLTLVKGLQIPQSRYSNGVLAVMHSAQYLWITSYYARREANALPGGKWRSSGYFGLLIVGGIALFIPGPWLASRVFHHDFTASFLIFTALVNLHHFILDGAIWKLRDGRVASLLLNSKGHITNVAAKSQSWFSSAWAWLSGNNAGGRWLRVSAALLLLIWGIVDQTRYYFALHSDNLQDLQRAALLNSFDGPTQMHLADRELQNGDPKDAEAAWRKAIRSNPADAAPRQELLHFLLEKQRFDEAYELTKESLAYAPRDANLWVDRGLLALRRGTSSEAIESWKRAIAIDPRQTLPHLYLAEEIDRSADPKAAATHYKIFLTAIARQPAAQRLPADQVIAVTLRMADCQARASETAEAVQSYQLAAKIAAQTKQSKLESVASVNEAALQEKEGKLSDALRLYQHALQLDESIGDRAASAEDWFAYGRFLQDSGFPSRLAYACFVKSASLDNALPDALQRQYVSQASEHAAKLAGRAAAEIRRNLEPALQEALALHP